MMLIMRFISIVKSYMKERITNLLKDKIVWEMLKAYILIMVLFFIIGIIKWNSLPPQLPLFYSLPRSNDQLGVPVMFMILPLISLLVFCLNLIFASGIFPKERLGAILLVIMGDIISFLLLITFIKIIFSVT